MAESEAMRRQTPQRTVFRDIAERAGVSVMTVSRVLNGKPDVAPSTRDAVLRHAHELGYRVSGGPRRRAATRTGLIGLMVPYVRGEGDYYADIVAGIADALYARDARAVLCPTSHEHDRERSLLDRLLRGTTDGAILIAPAESPEELAELRAQYYPFVVVDPISPLGDGVAVVAAMNTTGARLAVEHLLALGHTRIGAVTGPKGWPASTDRLAGYHAALVAAGIPVAPDLLQEGDFTLAGGEAAAARLLALPWPPTAILAFNDNMAFGTLRAARSSSLEVPRDLSVVGFDDIESAALVQPALTTIRQPLQEMGRAAVDVLYRQIADQPYDATRFEVSTRLVERASTAPLATHRAAPGR